jgi:prevent-host-death family protein
MDKTPRTWTAQDAKAKFSEVLDNAEDGAEQIITRHGKKIAKMVPITSADADDDFGSKLIAFMAKSPLRGVKLKLPRDRRVALKRRQVDL